MRGRCLGNDPRLVLHGFDVAVAETSSLASPSASTRAIPASMSSKASSNWSASIFSDLRPNMACLRAAISASRRVFYACCARMMAFRTSTSSGIFGSAFMQMIYQDHRGGASRNARPSHSAAVGGRAARSRTLRQSRPANSASNWAWFSDITPSRIAGQVKVCSSSCL